MKKFYSIPGIILGVVFLATTLIFTFKASDESEMFKAEKSRVSEILNFNDRLLSFRDWVFSEQAWLEKKEKYDAAQIIAQQHYDQASLYGYYVLLIAGAFLIVMIGIYMRRRIFFGITMALSFIAVALLVHGIMNPMMEIGAYKEDLKFKAYVKPKDIPHFEEALQYMGKAKELTSYLRYVPYLDGWAEEAEGLVDVSKKFLEDNKETDIGIDKVFKGRTYFYYQNKGIMDIISLLWETDNKLVATAIGTFSILVPLIKISCTLLVLILPGAGSERFKKFLAFISKWSMADVFVVGAFLAYLSFANMSPGVEMEANVMFGLYYFMGYVILSILLSIFLKWASKEKLKNRERLSNPEV